MLINRNAYDGQTGGVATLEINDEKSNFIPLVSSHLFGEITGPLFSGEMTHTFSFSELQCDQVIEAVYRFPLPGDAAVTGVTVKFGNVEISAELKERETAERDYEEAKRAGHQAALVKRESPDVFSLSIAGIEPGQPVAVCTHYIQLANWSDDAWTMRIPLTVAPRYSRWDEGQQARNGQPLALAVDPGYRFELSVAFPKSVDVICKEHALAFAKGNGEQIARLADGAILPNHDVELRWRSLAELEKPSLTVYRQTEDGWFLAEVMPPKLVESTLPREVLILVDHSGSMDGSKRSAADKTAAELIRALGDQDFFTVCIFDHETRWFNRKYVAADNANKVAAAKFIKGDRKSGGTELGMALEESLAVEASGAPVRHLLVMTDGQVSDFGRIIHIAEEEGKRSGGRRMHVVAIDSSPNDTLVRNIAAKSGGSAFYIDDQMDENMFVRVLQGVAKQLCRPVWQNLELLVDGKAYFAGRSGVYNSGKTSVVLGPVAEETPTWICGRTENGAGWNLVDGNGQLIDSQVREESRILPGIRRLFGAIRLLELEFLQEDLPESWTQLEDKMQAMGYRMDGEMPRSRYAERQRQVIEKMVKGIMVRESLESGVLCSETGFVAVRKELGRPVKAQFLVPNAMPGGWGRLEIMADVMCCDELEPLSDDILYDIFTRSRSRNAPTLNDQEQLSFDASIPVFVDSDAERKVTLGEWVAETNVILGTLVLSDAVKPRRKVRGELVVVVDGKEELRIDCASIHQLLTLSISIRAGQKVQLLLYPNTKNKSEKVHATAIFD